MDVKRDSSRFSHRVRTEVPRYGFAVVALLPTLALKSAVDAWLGSGPPLIFLVPAVTLAAWRGGMGPGLMATALSSLICMFVFFAPTGSMKVSSANDQFRLLLFISDGVLTSVLMGRLHESRRQAEQYRDAVRRSERQLQAILDYSTSPISLKDARGRFLLVNRRFEEIFHVQGQNLIGRTEPDLFPPELSRTMQLNDRVVLDQGVAAECEQILPGDDGDHTYISTKFPLMGPDGVPYAVGGISTDITALKEAQQRALQAERLAAIGQMIAGLAHESRNALQRGQACLEMLARRVQDRPEILDLVVGIQEAQDDLHRHYEEVRTYAAPIRLDRRECDLREVVHQSWDRLAVTRAGRSAELRFEGVEQPRGLADGFQLGQVFRNILDNSLAACHDPVSIRVVWREWELQGFPAWVVEFRDNGPGLSVEQRRRIFEPFYTTRTQGTGLGMAIARRIVEAHGGQIDVGPDNPPGATIRVTLPRGEP